MEVLKKGTMQSGNELQLVFNDMEERWEIQGKKISLKNFKIIFHSKEENKCNKIFTLMLE